MYATLLSHVNSLLRAIYVIKAFVRTAPDNLSQAFLCKIAIIISVFYTPKGTVSKTSNHCVDKASVLKANTFQPKNRH